jgi:hypothetical protein
MPRGGLRLRPQSLGLGATCSHVVTLFGNPILFLSIFSFPFVCKYLETPGFQCVCALRLGVLFSKDTGLVWVPLCLMCPRPGP